MEHMELDKGLGMVSKAGVGGKWISQKWLSNETNKKYYPGMVKPDYKMIHDIA